jgi:ferredoxin
MALEVWIDDDECVSSGKCVASAPGLFVFDDDELGTVDPSGARPDDDALVRIARACPSGAIRLCRDGVDVEI